MQIILRNMLGNKDIKKSDVCNFSPCLKNICCWIQKSNLNEVLLVQNEYVSRISRSYNCHILFWVTFSKELKNLVLLIMYLQKLFLTDWYYSLLQPSMHLFIQRSWRKTSRNLTVLWNPEHSLSMSRSEGKWLKWNQFCFGDK